MRYQLSYESLGVYFAPSYQLFKISNRSWISPSVPMEWVGVCAPSSVTHL